MIIPLLQLHTLCRVQPNRLVSANCSILGFNTVSCFSKSSTAPTLKAAIPGKPDEARYIRLDKSDCRRRYRSGKTRGDSVCTGRLGEYVFAEDVFESVALEEEIGREHGAGDFAVVDTMADELGIMVRKGEKLGSRD